MDVPCCEMPSPQPALLLRTPAAPRQHPSSLRSFHAGKKLRVGWVKHHTRCVMQTVNQRPGTSFPDPRPRFHPGTRPEPLMDQERPTTSSLGIHVGSPPAWGGSPCSCRGRVVGKFALRTVLSLSPWLSSVSAAQRQP